jgi:uncharacterized protein (TIGR00369 family)
MTNDEMIAQMNAHAPPALKTLGGKVISFDEDTASVEMHFTADESMCHSGDIVQGGFLAGMIDAAMAHAVFGALQEIVIVATLDINVSYLEIARAGKLLGRGRVIRLGKTIAFLEGELYGANGESLARGSSTARIIHRSPNR